MTCGPPCLRCPPAVTFMRYNSYNWRRSEIEKALANHHNSSFNVASQQDDPAFKRIAFLGLPDEMEYDARVEAMENFMKQNFPKIRIKDCSVFFRGPRANRVMTQTGYLEVSSSDIRNKLLNQIESRSLKCVIGGKEVRLQRARSQSAGKRNATLKLAMEALKQDKRTQCKNIKIEWTGVRGVTVDGIYAFTQTADAVGSFDDPFTDLTLP